MFCAIRGLVAFLLVTSISASAAGEPSTGSKVFLYGNSPGTPSAGKSVTVFSLYGAALVSWGAGGYLFVDASSEIEKNDQAISSCRNETDCFAQAERGDELRSRAALSTGFFALGSLFALSGVVTALVWDNEDVRVGAHPGGAWASVTF